jgi:hypothetical protein
MVVRAGFGYRGSINRKGIYPFSYYNMNTSGATYNNILYASTITYGNPVLKWEKETKQRPGFGDEFL